MRHSDPGEIWPDSRSGFNFVEELNPGGGGMVRPVIPERQPGVQMGQLCGFLQLPRFCLWLGPTEEPGGAPGTGLGTPC